MPSILRVVGVALLGVLILLIVSHFQNAVTPVAHHWRGPGSAFDGRSGVSVRELRDLTTQVNATLDAAWSRGRREKTLAQIADWASFAITSVITVLSASLALSLGDKEKNAPTETSPSAPTPVLATGRRRSYVIGILAAIASVSSGFGSRLDQQADRTLRATEELNDKLAAKLALVNDGGDVEPLEVRQLIGAVKTKMAELQ